METKAHHLLIGAFALIVTFGAALFVLWLSRVQVNAQYAYYDVLFNDGVTGLPIGGEVRYSGVKVGTVEAIRFDPASPSAVHVLIKVVSRDDFTIRQNSEASLQFSGITGITFILVSGGSADSPALPRVKEKDGKLPVLVAQESAVKKILKDAPQIATRTREAVEGINRILTPENEVKLSRIIDNLDRLSQNLAEASVNVKAAAQKTPALVDELHAASKSIADLGALSNEVVAENRAAINSFSVQGAAQLNALTAEARQLVSTLDRIAARAEGDPARYILGNDERTQEIPIRK